MHFARSRIALSCMMPIWENGTTSSTPAASIQDMYKLVLGALPSPIRSCRHMGTLHPRYLPTMSYGWIRRSVRDLVQLYEPFAQSLTR
jgi:hypothetical protein